ncbi:hypothetical protein QTP88_008062 [Uroleucon formosanum]
MAKKEHYTTTIINGFYNQLPAFSDVFDEESWYLFVICFVTFTLIPAGGSNVEDYVKKHDLKTG